MPSPSNKAVIQVFLKHLKPHRWLFGALVFFILLSEIAAILVPLFYKQLFDGIDAAAGDLSSAIGPLTAVLLAILGLHAASWLFHRVAKIANNYLQPQVMADIERAGFEHLLGHSSNFFANNFTGSLIRKVRRLSRAYEDFSDVVQWDFMALAVTIVGSMVVIWFRSPLIAGAALVWVAVFAAINYAVARWRLKYDEQRAAHDTKVTAVLADAVSNTATIRLFTNQKHEQGLFRDITAKHRKITTRSWNIAEINDALQWGLMIIIEFVVMALAVRLWAQGELTIGDFAMLQGYLAILFTHINRLGRIIRRTYEAFADAKEMVEILHTPHEVKDVKNAKPLTVTKGAITFTDVNFSYRKTRHVLKKFNLSIMAREKVALVGPSGSGKSTTVQLILRQFNIQRGTITIDNQNIAAATMDSVRENIALVPQDPALFHRSLMENIRYGRLDAKDEEVMEAARKAHCDVFINKLPEQYATYVGERGIKLSGGERQRIAIGRAILKDAPILVLDEATSSLDSESEALIQDALHELMKNKTAIVIAHRLSTILYMDRIVVMAEGEVVDTGTHQELSKKEGLYRRLWKIQSEGFIK